MATTGAVDLSTIVLFLGNIMGTGKILELSENSRYEFHPLEGNDDGLANWTGNQSDKLTAPFLGLVFGEHMYSPQGWVIGSSDDSDTCNLQVAKDNTTSVSRRHFRIDLSPDTHRPRLTVLSRNSVQIHIYDRTVTLDQGHSLEIISAVTINMGEVTEEQRYRRNAEKFSKEFLDALPKLPISLNATRASTFDFRFGRNNAVYKHEETGTTSTGSFASVMKVKELHSQKIFAAKVPHFKASDPASKVRKRWESLTEEFEKIVKLEHPHIVQAIEVLTGGHGNEPPWLIMEWIEDDLSSTSLDDRNVPTLLTHVSKGLAYMHANGFTHRDLKPANILLQLNRRRLTAAKIADFGTTKYDLSGKMQTYTGSGVYMAPEFWEQELAYTNAVDMWSFGLIAVELLTGWETKSDGWDPRFPPTRAQHQKWIRKGLRPRVSVVPERFRPLLLGLLSETPEARWTAIDCEEWLLKNEQADTGSCRKRGASPLGEDTGYMEHRRVRSSHPTLSTTRADNNSPPGSTNPDTEPWGSPPPNSDDVEPLDDVRNQDTQSPPGSPLPETEPPWGSPAPNPADVEPSDEGGDSVKVKVEPVGGRTPKASPKRESATLWDGPRLR